MPKTPAKTEGTYRYVHIPHGSLKPSWKAIDVHNTGFVARLENEKTHVPHGVFLGERPSSIPDKAYLAKIASESGLTHEQVGSVPAHKRFFTSRRTGITNIGEHSAKKSMLYFRILTPEERSQLRG
ncbi:MAG: hypothetical protein WCX64_01470 [Candidatus Micrarchaeia archaeon]|jgi:hypothetical protein